MSDLTVIELMGLLRERIGGYQVPPRDQQPAERAEQREYSLALTALEDVGMRFTRGRAMALGVFAPADLERIGDDPQAASRHLADRDQAASDAARIRADVGRPTGRSQP